LFRSNALWSVHAFNVEYTIGIVPMNHYFSAKADCSIYVDHSAPKWLVIDDWHNGSNGAFDLHVGRNDAAAGRTSDAEATAAKLQRPNDKLRKVGLEIDGEKNANSDCQHRAEAESTDEHNGLHS
jgi:hypothetical protein